MFKKILFYLQSRKLLQKLLFVLCFSLILLCIIKLKLNEKKIDFIYGWEANKTRFAKDYVFPYKLTSVSFIKSPCPQLNVPFMIIIVCSSVQNADLRLAIRKTWGVDATKYNISVYFLVGISSNHKINRKNYEESSQYNDLIIENIVDSYNNLTLKSLMLLKWVNQNCQNVKLIMKSDDDVYINIFNLFWFIKSIDENQLNNLLIGKLYTKEKPQRKLSSKWYIPKYMYPADYYPHYLCGVGYIMSNKVALKLYAESFKHQFIYLEDVFITGICAEALKIIRKDNLAFHFFEHHVNVECNSIHPHLILLSHNLNSWEMYDIHKQISAC